MAETEGKTGVIDKSGVPMTGTPPWARQAQQQAAAEGQQQQQQQQSQQAGAGESGGGAAAGAAAAGAAAPAAGSAEGQQPDFETLKTFLKAQGIEGFETVDDLKGLVKKATAPPPKELTPEEKATAEAKIDERMLNRWLKQGGKVEDYVALKNVATGDLKEMSRNEIIRELKAAKFSDEQITNIIAERYYTGNPDELQKGENEDDAAFEARKAFAKQKQTYGSQTLENRALPIRKQAESLLKGLRDAITAEDADAENEQKFSTTVDEFTKTFSREVTLDFGEINGEKIEPSKITIPEETITEIANTLKDPAKRQQLLFNPDDTLNLPNLVRLMAIEKYFTTALQKGYSEGGSRKVAEFEKRFGGKTPGSLGVGGNTGPNTSGSGKIVKSGKPVHVARQT